MKMALAAVFRQSRRLDNSLLVSLKPLSTNRAQVTISYRFQHQQQHRSKEHESKQETNGGSTCMIGFATGIAVAGLFASGKSNDIFAEEPDELEQVLKKEVIDQENR